jgi:hypothetical protein
MSDNLVCDKCGKQFNNRPDFEKHKQQHAGTGQQQSEQTGQKDRPITRGAGGGSVPSE